MKEIGELGQEDMKPNMNDGNDIKTIYLITETVTKPNLDARSH